MAYSLDIVLGDCGNPYWQEQELWYRRLLPEFGMTGTIHYPNREGDPVSQTELVEKLLTRGSEVLILNALDGDAVARTAARLRTPALICDVGETMPPDAARDIPRRLAIRTDSCTQQGKLSAQTLLSGVRPLRRFLCVGGPRWSKIGVDRVTGALSAASAYPDLEKRTVWSDLTREGGRAAAEQMLPWHPDAIFCANDLMALGVLDALLEHGVKLPVGSVERIPSAVHAVRTGDLKVTVGPDGGEIVSHVLRSVDGFLTAGIRPGELKLKELVVTRESLLAEARRRRRFR